MRRALRHRPLWLLSAVLAAACCPGAADVAPGQTVPRLPAVEKAYHRGYVERLAGTKVQFEMVAIPGGTFLMGSPPGEPGRAADEGPQHPVTVRPFWMGKCEVTWDEFDLYMKKDWKKPLVTVADRAADSVTRPTPPYIDETWGYGREGYPVLCISHHAAMEYCRWLSAKTGKLYRLPTEAEWEWACRAGTATAYSFGDEAGKLDEHAWHEKNSEEASHPVGKKKANPWGLHDMHGNVAEWCLDHYFADEYKKFPLGRTGLAPVELPTKKRWSHVARGGSWVDRPAALRSAARRGSDRAWLRRDPERPPSIWWLTDADFVGFRVVRAVNEQDNLRALRSKVTRASE